MKIESITLREIQMPLVHFFETSFGRLYSRRILLLTAGCEGVDGWGECVAGEDPFYSSGMDRDRLGNHQALPGAGCIGEASHRSSRSRRA